MRPPVPRDDDGAGATDRPPAASRPNRRGRGDAGASTSLAAALLTPVFVALAFAAWQAALWGHARTEARVVARDTAALVARSAVAPGDATASAQAALSSTDLRDVVVTVGGGSGLVTVTVTGEAPGILYGTSRRVSVTEAVPVEELSP